MTGRPELPGGHRGIRRWWGVVGDCGGGHRRQVFGKTAGHVDKNEGDHRGRSGMGDDGRGWAMTTGAE